jgi:hypothetical protein
MVRIVLKELSCAKRFQDIGKEDVLRSHLLLGMLGDTERLARDLFGDPPHNRFGLFRSHVSSLEQS